MYNKCLKDKCYVFITAIVMLVSLNTACSSSQTVNENVSLTTKKINTVQVKKGNMDYSTSFSGVLIPAKATSMRFSGVSGSLKKLYVNENDYVKTGQEIAEIDIGEIEKQIAEKEIYMQQWYYKKLQYDENISISGRSVKLAQMDLKDAQLVYNDTQNSNNLLALQRAQMLYEQALSNEKNALRNKKISDLQYTIDINELNDLKSKLSKNILKSTVEGMVVSVSDLAESSLINVNTEIAKIADLKSLVFQFVSPDAQYLHEIENGKLTIGNETYRVSSYTPKTSDYIAQTGTDVKLKNRVYLSFNDKIPTLNINKTTQAKLEFSKKDVLMVPKSAIREDNDIATVSIWVNGKTSLMEVVRGIEKDGYIEIVSGLNEDTTITLP